MATGSIRLAWCQDFLDRLRNHTDLVGVQCEFGYPGDEMADECVYVGNLTGDYEVPTFKAGRLYRDDQFKVDVSVSAATDGGTPIEAAQRVETMCAAIDDVLADNPNLDDLDGTIDCVVGKLDGPNAVRVVEGSFAFATVQIEVHARYT